MVNMDNSTPSGEHTQDEWLPPIQVDEALLELRSALDTVTDPEERLRVLNYILDGQDARFFQGERQKLDPWGRWMHSTYLDASQGHADWTEGEETRTIIESWDGDPKANLIVSDTGIDNSRGVRLHVPMFDIDLPMRVVPSTNPGKGHLYINKPMPWSSVLTLLDALVDVGVVHRNYRAHSLERGSTTLRPAFVDKPKKGWSSDSEEVLPDGWEADPHVPAWAKQNAAATSDRTDPATCAECADGVGRTKPGPGHTASSLCRSGRRPHCTCDTCY